MLRRRFAVTLLGLALVAGCSSTEHTPEKTPAEALAAARASLAKATSVHLVLASTEVPAGQNGVTAGDGDGEFSATEAKFAGTITGTVNGLTGNIAIICVGDQAWWKLFTPDYTPADLASVNAPNPCTLFHPETGIASLVAATTDPVAKGKTRSGKDVVTSYAGKLPGAPISELLHLGDGTGTYDVTFGITDAGELRQATMTGPFFAGATSTYTLTLSNYGKAVTITAPQ
ncbi:MAG TPA: LppX_LprAFG lipoprotein [Phycicoccus elongatus]|jgi:lipoprotein LprG|uniref:LppX_LprAFG lipoprotein n=1 Tax=Phycicoccus TaxID=367298 RepID=UPI001D658853|nr:MULTISPECIES: LppX_LprAFG lipoprotein [Phycicoccus]MCB1239077.1 LppX_LprAFG lipoprotein [Tetrasphaera sp.]MCB9407062.1 LppX_LprAFG lipoprotein [Tetrasphaera sp.]MCO5303230.1 LppX_LprAFG lipoprotein [Phycicoccus sp.]HPK11379.1 LppX_LprAFG lipoprotein [Phycicoccus elongatus]HPQ72447.1 LppX_LprAFG lipoprotein [Phycicoccus elongatus]